MFFAYIPLNVWIFLFSSHLGFISFLLFFLSPSTYNITPFDQNVKSFFLDFLKIFFCSRRRSRKRGEREGQKIFFQGRRNTTPLFFHFRPLAFVLRGARSKRVLWYLLTGKSNDNDKAESMILQNNDKTKR